MIPTADPSIAGLCQRFHVRQFSLFGSAADGRFDPAHSDLDFLVTFEDLPASAYADAYFGLREALIELFSRDVDLLTQPALENPYLRRQVTAQLQQLYPPP